MIYKRIFYPKNMYVFCLMLSISLTFSALSFQQIALAQNNVSGTIQCITIQDNSTSVAGPSPSPQVVDPLGQDAARGIANISDLEKATGDNTDFFFGPQDLGNNVAVLEGMEKSQGQAVIPGTQDVIFEGEIYSNVTHQCWQN